MYVLEQDRVKQFADGWYWRCCYGCHGCSGCLFGPWPSKDAALQARAENRFGPKWVDPDTGATV